MALAIRPIKKLHVPAKPNGFATACKLPWWGNPAAKVMFVVDPVVYDEEKEKAPTGAIAPLSRRFLEGLAPFMKSAGISSRDICVVSACHPVSRETWDRDKMLGDKIKEAHPEFLAAHAAMKPKLVVAMGKAAARQVYNRAVKITKIRGISEYAADLKAVVLPTLGIAQILRVPEHSETLQADLHTAARIIAAGFSLSKENEALVTDYKWCLDLQFMIDRKPKLIGLDTESSSFGQSDFPHWYLPQSKIMTVQLSDREGTAYVVPIDYPQNYPGKPKTPEACRALRQKLVRQLKTIIEDPEVKKVGQNLKHDYLQMMAKLDIRMQGYEDDTLMLVHMLNENMQSKALDEIARVHIPKMAGYKDQFRRKYERKVKVSEDDDDTGHEEGSISRMDLVNPEDILAYSAADADCVLRLHRILTALLKKDPKNYNCYQKVCMPALRAFCEIEPNGFKINRKALEELRVRVSKKQAEEYRRLIRQIPQVIRDKYENTGVGLKLTRDVFMRDFLFTHERGLKLPARTFTKSSTKDNKIPSISTKQHLPYFANIPFVRDYIVYVKNQKMLDTYIGEDGHHETVENKKTGVKTRHWVPPTGFWKYIVNEFIRPAYALHKTVTGRSASSDPNGQNFPKRGEFAKAYRAVFEAPDGWVLIEADYSQLELRIAGILAKEPTFLKLYREGGDIHCATAAVVMGISLEAFMALKTTDPDTFALQRYRAKAVNFGFLYGMGWRKFLVYAKTDYGIDYTEAEAQAIRTAFFTKYSALGRWHDQVKEFVQRHGFVRALDGRVRHLPAVGSDDNSVSSSAERQAVNSPVQGFGSDLGLIALTRINNELDKSWLRVIGFVHDAVICIAKKGREMEAARLIKRYMETNPVKEWFGFEPPIPIVSEVAIGMNLAKTIELKQKWLDDPRVVHLEQIKAFDDEASAANDLDKAVKKNAPLPELVKARVAAARAKAHAKEMLENYKLQAPAKRRLPILARPGTARKPFVVKPRPSAAA